MKRVAIIYTVKSVLNTFEDKLRAELSEDVLIHNLYDDFLAHDPSPLGSGVFTVKNKQRLYNDIQSCALTGADVIIVTCSTLSRVVEQVRPFCSVPIIAIDDAMFDEAVQCEGNRIHLLATAASTIPTSTAGLMAFAEDRGKQIKLTNEDNFEAYEAMKRGDMALHDKLVLEQAAKLKDYDVIVLAQASMSHLEKQVQELTGIKTVSSVSRCIQRAKAMLKL